MLTISHAGTDMRDGSPPTPEPDPLLVTTVPRGYVHRASVAEVLLTGWGRPAAEPVAEARDRFTVHAQWPRNHAFHASRGGYQDALLLVETVRQAGILVSHAEYAVPLDHQFVMHHIGFQAEASAFAAGSAPTEIELHLTCRDIVRRGRTIGGMTYDVAVLRDGHPVARAGARFNCVSPAVHDRLRGVRPTTTSLPIPAPIDPADVGHLDERNVVLAAPGPEEGQDPDKPHRWRLRVDTGHPAFFDHPVDHVPGMLLIEAARQAARVVAEAPDALLLTLDSRFERYAELDEPAWIEARADGGGLISVTGRQGDEVVFESTLAFGGPA